MAARLTERQQTIVSLVTEGLTNREISVQICTSEHVVKTELIRIYDVLGFNNRVEIALYWIKNSEGGPQT
jgi:DNA-binding NarL/FixJ family response regulator